VYLTGMAPPSPKAVLLTFMSDSAKPMPISFRRGRPRFPPVGRVPQGARSSPDC